MAIHVQRHANVSKQAMLLDELDVSPLKLHVCGCGLNRFIHEGMNHISNLKFHLKTRSGNVNMSIFALIKGHNSGTNERKIMCNNPKLYLDNMNAYIKFGDILSISSQDVELK